MIRIRKNSICDFEMRGNRKVYQKGKSISKINWFSKSFKIKNSAIPPTDKSVGILASNIRL